MERTVIRRSVDGMTVIATISDDQGAIIEDPILWRESWSTSPRGPFYMFGCKFVLDKHPLTAEQAERLNGGPLHMKWKGTEREDTRHWEPGTFAVEQALDGDPVVFVKFTPAVDLSR